MVAVSESDLKRGRLNFAERVSQGLEPLFTD
jgi:hypothetical protein